MRIGTAPNQVRTLANTTAVKAAPKDDVSAKSNLMVLGDGLVTGLMFGATELRELGTNDPSLAFRSAATIIAPNLMSGVNNPVVTDTANIWVVPVVRSALLGINTWQAVRTFKDPDAHMTSKFLDGARVASDLAGTVGGLALLFTPKYAELGAKLVGAAYAFDIGSHAIRTLQHGANRVKVWESNYKLWKEGEKPAEQLEPNPAPAPVPVPAVPALKPIDSEQLKAALSALRAEEKAKNPSLDQGLIARP